MRFLKESYQINFQSQSFLSNLIVFVSINMGYKIINKKRIVKNYYPIFTRILLQF